MALWKTSVGLANCLTGQLRVVCSGHSMEDTMDHATRLVAPLRRAGEFLLHFTHGSLLVAGLIAGAVVVSGKLPVRGAGAFDMVAAEQADVVDASAAVPVAAPVVAPKPVAVELGDDDLSGEMARVRDWVSQQYRVSSLVLEPVLLAAQEAGRHAGIDPLLIVAVMAVESRFNPFAESQSGAQGLMQVIPRFHMDKIGKAKGEDALFDPELNVRVGTLVLREGLRRYGSLQAALQYYGGALSDPDAGYARKVMAVKKRLISAAGRKAGTDV